MQPRTRNPHHGELLYALISSGDAPRGEFERRFQLRPT